MPSFTYTDALTGAILTFDEEADGQASVEFGTVDVQTPTLFLPGCSFINYGMALVDAVYNTLVELEAADGITLLCCGKILSYEPDGKARRARHEQELRAHLVAAGVQRIVTACPNCVKALRAALAADEATASIEVVPLPKVMAECGFEAEPGSIARVVKGKDDALGAGVMLCAHDSCPDRATGEFAESMRALLPESMWVDPPHNRAHSICCGSLARAAGHFDVADRQAVQNATEALEMQADCLVTACVSCAFQLNMTQDAVPARYVMELLYEWPIAWEATDQYMKLRFLFEDEAPQEGGRAFAGLDATFADRAAELEAEAEVAAEEAGLVDEEAFEDFERDERLAGSVSISNRDVEVLGE